MALFGLLALAGGLFSAGANAINGSQRRSADVAYAREQQQALQRQRALAVENQERRYEAYEAERDVQQGSTGLGGTTHDVIDQDDDAQHKINLGEIRQGYNDSISSLDTKIRNIRNSAWSENLSYAMGGISTGLNAYSALNRFSSLSQSQSNSIARNTHAKPRVVPSGNRHYLQNRVF